MTDFVLVDLASQVDAVWKCVPGWTVPEILAWLSKHGTVEYIQHPMDTYCYSFRSGIGIESIFRLSADGQLWIYLREHNFYQPS